MTNRPENNDPAVPGHVAPTEPVCPYCKKPDAEWSPEDLKRGRRQNSSGILYHCYDGYCWD